MFVGSLRCTPRGDLGRRSGVLCTWGGLGAAYDRDVLRTCAVGRAFVCFCRRTGHGFSVCLLPYRLLWVGWCLQHTCSFFLASGSTWYRVLLVHDSSRRVQLLRRVLRRVLLLRQRAALPQLTPILLLGHVLPGLRI